jgi:hypothetical protein
MSEKTTPPDTQELAQRFVQFIMIQAQNVLYVLGKIPGPDGRAPEPNLEAGKMLIDQLDMISHKTAGNLSDQESKILKDTLSELQMAFVDSSGGTPASMMPDRSPKINLDELEQEQESAPPQPKPEPATAEAPAPAASSEPAPAATPEPAPESKESKDSDEDEGDKKKFFKSYG